MSSLTHSVAKSWSSTSTWHGVQDVCSSRRGFFRTLWTGVLIVASGMLLWQLYQVVNNYLNSLKYLTTITTSPAVSLQLPNITLCNYNRANSSRMAEVGLTPEALAYLYLSLPQNYKISSFALNTTDKLRSAYDDWVSRYNRTVDVQQIFGFLGHDCLPTFLYCQFSGISFNCCGNVTSVTNQFGKCLSIAPAAEQIGFWSDSSQFDPGPQGGMSLVMDPGLTYYSNIVTNDFVSQGMMLLITNEPEAYQIADLVGLQPGSVVFVCLTAAKSYVNAPTYQVWPLPCKLNAKLRYMPGEYTHNKCSLDCFIETIIQYCHCGFWARSELGLTPCSGEHISCLNDMWYGTANWSQPGQIRFHDCTIAECQQPCETRFTFDYRVTSTVLTEAQRTAAQVSYAKLLTNPWANTEELIHLEIYYGSIELTIKETNEKSSVFDIISNIGGQMGLWGGMSVVSLIQLVMFLLSICHSIAFHTGNRIRDRLTS